MVIGLWNTCLLLLCTLLIIGCLKCNAQAAGPDPWNYEDKDIGSNVHDDKNIPPDLRVYPKKKSQPDSNYANGEWFYRRILSIVLKGGQVKTNEDGSVDVSLKMKLNDKQWQILDEYLTSTTTLSEEMFRRSLGFIEQSIYKPSIPTKIILAWSDFIQMYLSEYKSEITYTLAALGIAGLLFWIWNHMSHKNAIILILIVFYCYEVFISYKEAEQKEVDMFVTALNSCKWYMWSSKCELPKPDPLIFLKHMNPMKIGIRMFTNLISEPIISLSHVVKAMTHGITDGLWYPFDVIFYGILITFFNILLLFFLIMIIFNFILNIPFNLSIFGLVNVGLSQRNRTMFTDTYRHNQNHGHSHRVENTNAIAGPTLDKLLDVCARALNAQHRDEPHIAAQNVNNSPRRRLTSTTGGIKRSASTGRLPDSSSFEDINKGKITRRNVGFRIDGTGDAH